jgi:hypothetical protein
MRFKYVKYTRGDYQSPSFHQFGNIPYHTLRAIDNRPYYSFGVLEINDEINARHGYGRVDPAPTIIVDLQGPGQPARP